MNSPIILSTGSPTVSVSQLVTDFGRTHELVKSSNLHAQAQQENVTATRADVLLRVNQAYFGVLKAQAVLASCRGDRQIPPTGRRSSQRLAEEQSQVRPGRELCERGFGAGAAPADSSAERRASFLRRTFRRARLFRSADFHWRTSPCRPLLRGRAPLLQEAFQNRPEVIRQGLRREIRAELCHGGARSLVSHDLCRRIAGLIPYRQDTLPSRYAAAGFNVNIPIFNGRLFNARAHGSNVASPRAAAISPRPSKSNCSGRPHGLAQRRLRLPAPFGHATTARPEATQAFDLAQGTLPTGLEFDRRTEPGAVEFDAGPGQQGQRAIRLRKPNRQFELSVGAREMSGPCGSRRLGKGHLIFVIPSEARNLSVVWACGNPREIPRFARNDKRY
jgi:hypothetical protein